jgi:hypothetical protein
LLLEVSSLIAVDLDEVPGAGSIGVVFNQVKLTNKRTFRGGVEAESIVAWVIRPRVADASDYLWDWSLFAFGAPTSCIRSF